MAPKKKGKGKKKAQQRTKKPASSTTGPSSAASKGAATSGGPSQREPSVAAPEAEAAPGDAGPEVGDRGQLVGLNSRPDLNGRRVEVLEQVTGKDGAPRFRVELLFGTGAGTVMKVKAANLDLDKDRVLEDPALNTLVAAMQALAPGAVPEEERRDWAGLPEELLVKIAKTHVAQTEAGWEAGLKERGWPENEVQEHMAEREDDGTCYLFTIAMVCKGWRKAQLKVGGRLRTRVESEVLMPGSVALAKWALAEGCPRENEDGFTMAGVAAQFGHMELVQVLIQEQGFAMNKLVMTAAASSGNLELVRWLRGKGCHWSAWACRVAAGAGRTGVLQWLRAHGCPWDADTCEQAASGGHLETLQWLRANGCPWDAGVCQVAAKKGHLETLRWAHENGCDLDAGACFNAAASGRLEVLQWLRAEGCPWDLNTCHWAVDQGHAEVLRWARENGAPWHVQTRDRAAAELGYTDGFGNLVG